MTLEIHRARACEFTRVWAANASSASNLSPLQQQQHATWSITDASAVSITSDSLQLQNTTLQISIPLTSNTTLHRLSLRTQLPQNAPTMLKAQLNGRTMAIKSSHKATASNEILLGPSSAVAVRLPCNKNVADSVHDMEFVWHGEWLRWYVDGVMLLEEFKLQEREDDNVLIELSVEEASLTIQQMELSAANASDPYCAPRYSTSSNCREQEPFSPRLGSVRGSLSVVQVDAFIDEVATNYPLITKVEYLGRSVEGRPLRALCLGACNISEDKKIPQALFTGMHHAREPISMMNLVYTIDILTSDYRNGELAALELLASRQLWFILVVNPDGYAHNEMARVWEHNKMGQRKSGAPTCDRSPPDAGVDLNRNYDVCFARDSKGSSNEPCGDDYNGPSAFSEPETRAVRDIVERNTSDFSVALNYHSYGKYINLPFACQAEGQPTEPNNALFVALAREMAHFNGFNYGQSWKDSNLYTVNGETSDWMWQAHGIFAMSPEVGPGFQVAPVPGFWPLPSDVPQLSSELHYSNLYVARMAGPVYALEVQSIQLGAVDDGDSTVSFVSVDVAVSNTGLRPGSAELVGSVFVNGSSASDAVQLELKAGPDGSGTQSHTVMIPYSGDDFHQSMREIKDLFLVVRDSLSCQLFRVAVHFHTDVERTNHPSFQTWTALPLPRCGTCELFGASEHGDAGLPTSPVCGDIKDVASLESVHTRDVDVVISGIEDTTSRSTELPSSTSTVNVSSSAEDASSEKQASLTSSILPSSVSWSGFVAMAAFAGLVLLVVVALFIRRRRGGPKKKPSRAKAAAGAQKRRSNVQYSRIDANSPAGDDYDEDETGLVDAECGDRGLSDEEEDAVARRTTKTLRASTEDVV